MDNNPQSDAQAYLKTFLDQLAKSFENKDVEAFRDLFLPNGWLREYARYLRVNTCHHAHRCIASSYPIGISLQSPRMAWWNFSNSKVSPQSFPTLSLSIRPEIRRSTLSKRNGSSALQLLSDVTYSNNFTGDIYQGILPL